MGKEWIISAGSELRCEIKEKESLVVHLREGNAEIFGIELAIDHKYHFNGEENFAIFSWYGCKVETEGASLTPGGGLNTVLYTSNETPMTALVNVHAQLEARRDIALLNGTSGGSSGDGPRVLVVGPPESGTSTAARILAMYAARLDRTPILADIDVSQSMVCSCLPGGCLGAISVDKTCLSIEDCFDSATPLVHFFGHTSPGQDPDWYRNQVSALADTIQQKLQQGEVEARSAGLIVHAGAWSDQGAGGGTSTEMLHHAIQAFKIDIVLVIGHDRLHSTLTEWSKSEARAPPAVLEKDSTSWRQQQRAPGLRAAPPVIVVKLARSGGVVSRSEADRRRSRRVRVHEYFYGKQQGQSGGAALPPGSSSATVEERDGPPRFRPHRLELSLSGCTFLRPGGVRLSDSMRPLGTGEGVGQQEGKVGGLLQPVPPSADLEHAVLAVLQAPGGGDDTQGDCRQHEEKTDSMGGECANSSVAGFLYVVKVEPDLNTVTVLSPCPGALPNTRFLVGSIKWME